MLNFKLSLLPLKQLKQLKQLKRSQLKQSQLKQEQLKQEQLKQEQLKQEQHYLTIYSKIYSVIPLNIFQTWYTLDLPPKMKENVELLKEQNPEFKYHLYDDNMCREFIKNNFNEDVLYTFDKLKPGAYKADLWRCCVLYIHGGIYLNIKYKCANNFKLIFLTDKEYVVKDRCFCDVTGIYNALMIFMPNNNILYKAIELIVKNVKNNIYGISSLDITGPHMLSLFFNNSEIKNFNLSFNDEDDSILYNQTKILTIYNEYREEQLKTQKNDYSILWNKIDIYNFPLLLFNKTYDFTRQIEKNILAKNTILYSSTPNIIEISNDTYLINFRWINYKINNDGIIEKSPQQWISLNSKFVVDLNFNKISNEIFLNDDIYKDNKKFIGIEDIRIYNYKNNFYYIGSYSNNKKNVSMSSSIYNISTTEYNIIPNIILPKMYNTSIIKIDEKNWSFVEYKNKLCVIYYWFPLQIGEIDYSTNTMDIIEIKYNIPDYFKNARGSTSGYIYNKEIWFVLHKTQYKDNKKNYQHFFAIFDLYMNLIRYSELFKLGNCMVEFCTGLIIKNDKIILSYSLLDSQSIISEYTMDSIHSIKWYLN
jgi:mannosyltransferase OCH1-like enzyme